MINVYKMDKSTCCKHIVAEKDASVSYKSRDEETRKKMLIHQIAAQTLDLKQVIENDDDQRRS